MISEIYENCLIVSFIDAIISIRLKMEGHRMKQRFLVLLTVIGEAGLPHGRNKEVT